MQIITLNLNGIRAAAKKGFFEWLSAQSAEIVCVQELKAQLSDLSSEMLSPDDFIRPLTTIDTHTAIAFLRCAMKVALIIIG